MNTFSLRSSVRMIALFAPLTLLACSAGSSESDDDAEQALRRKKSSAVATGAVINLRVKNGGFVGTKIVSDSLGISLRMKLGDTLRVVNDDSQPFDVIESNDPIEKVIAPGASADFKPTRGNSVDFLSAFPTRGQRTNNDTSELLLEILDLNTPLPTQPCCDLPGGG